MTIYIQKDDEDEYRFSDWEDVIDYAKERERHDASLKKLNQEITKELEEQ